MGLTSGKRMGVLVAVAVAIVAVVALVPAGQTTAFQTYEHANGACDGCHGLGDTSLVTVTGLPVGAYNPGQDYVITITIIDANGAGTGMNAFDMVVSAGSLTESDANAEINAAGLEASSYDSGDFTATSWTVTWTAPSSGSASIEIWGVYGVDSGDPIDSLYDYESYSFTEVPEFPVVALPVIGMLGAVLGVLVLIRKK